MMTPHLETYNPNDCAHLYHEYYQDQHGSGIVIYKGVKNQAGHGIASFFGKMLKKTMPLLKKAGTRALSGAVGLAQDAMAGKNIAASAKARAMNAGKGFLGDVSSDILGTPGNQSSEGDEPPPRPPARKRKKRGKQRGRGVDLSGDIFTV